MPVFPTRGELLGVDSSSILSNHRSFQKPIAVSPRFFMVSWKDSDPWTEWEWKVALEKRLVQRKNRGSGLQGGGCSLIFHVLKNICDFPLSVLKGIDH